MLLPYDKWKLTHSRLPFNERGPKKWCFYITLCNKISTMFSTCRYNYLFNQTTWSICKKPENIVIWNIVLFSLLLGIGTVEAVLCLIQVINGFIGFICGTCMKRRKVGIWYKLLFKKLFWESPIKRFWQSVLYRKCKKIRCNLKQMDNPK